MSVYGKNVKSGYYEVVNKSKLINEKKTLFFRSMLEAKMMQACDHSSNIIKWAYEDTIIPYVKPSDPKRPHRYIMDFRVFKQMPGGIKEFLIEVKPFSMTMPPKPQKRITKKYLEKLENWSTNEAKWLHAIEWCKKRGKTFTIVTEKNLGG